MVKSSDTVGSELKKEYREIVSELTANQGWRYDNGRHRGGHPLVFPLDKTKMAIPVPTTPGSQRSLRNFIGQVRRAGGLWPPPRTTGGAS